MCNTYAAPARYLPVYCCGATAAAGLYVGYGGACADIRRRYIDRRRPAVVQK